MWWPVSARAATIEAMPPRASTGAFTGDSSWTRFPHRGWMSLRAPLPCGTSSVHSSTRIRPYLSDSVFAFTDLPVRVLWIAGLLGLALGLLFSIVIVVARAAGAITVPGYAATILAIVFFGSLNMIGLGIVGSYVWRAYETAKGRPGAIVRDVVDLPKGEVDA
jgi:hypothetical protein